MNPEVLKLESIRQSADTFGWLAGSLADYIDRGHPDPAQEREAQAQMESYIRERDRELRELHILLTQLRETDPSVVEEWAGWHISLCRRTIADCEQRKAESLKPVMPGDDLSVSLYVAGETLQAWEEVRTGTRDFVSINTAFLEEYYQEITSAVEQYRKRQE